MGQFKNIAVASKVDQLENFAARNIDPREDVWKPALLQHNFAETRLKVTFFYFTLRWVKFRIYRLY